MTIRYGDAMIAHVGTLLVEETPLPLGSGVGPAGSRWAPVAAIADEWSTNRSNSCSFLPMLKNVEEFL